MAEVTQLEAQQAGLLMPVAPIELLKGARETRRRVIREYLREGTDYETRDGRSILLKPGTERLCELFGCTGIDECTAEEVNHDWAATYELPRWVDTPKPNDEEIEAKRAAGRGRFRKGDGGKWIWQEKQVEAGATRGLYRFAYRVTVVSRADHSLAYGSGVGSCSTLEAKYIRNPWEYENTVRKMALKRAHVDAWLRAMGLSDEFTQDLEDAVEAVVTPAAPDTESTPGKDSQGPARTDNDSGKAAGPAASVVGAAPSGEEFERLLATFEINAVDKRELFDHFARAGQDPMKVVPLWCDKYLRDEATYGRRPQGCRRQHLLEMASKLATAGKSTGGQGPTRTDKDAGGVRPNGLAGTSGFAAPDAPAWPGMRVWFRDLGVSKLQEDLCKSFCRYGSFVMPELARLAFETGVSSPEELLGFMQGRAVETVLVSVSAPEGEVSALRELAGEHFESCILNPHIVGGVSSWAILRDTAERWLAERGIRPKAPASNGKHKAGVK